ncbi:ABC transporter ATP-binding protein [Enterococcus sp. 669A]|uniref:ABC transporter ATP-binding protein n=1 Tax=Candidatus Enterococcus moelleringii TaxID=2815325 RepID=A0ABS3L6H3_9ENTE|nr:ABC transporter ATP-binding protein [Enterococcus sp. 669A]MBO1305218.1 ABC transporter ATP-binding protein [Enterococcus sp. 669A]
MKEELLKLRHISKVFINNHALKDINMTLAAGEILGFLGPSGAGKTTTIKIITGQMIQSSGEAFILGSDTRKLNEKIYEKIGIVTDASGIYEEFSVYENLLLFAQLLQVPKERIEELLDRVGLTEQKKQLAGKLSKGQEQRLILARAVLHQPKVLFLDEPTSGLDPTTAREIHRLLLELKEAGMGIFLTTHNMEEAAKLCDHVALLNDGKIVEFGTPQEICLRYNSEKKYRVLLNTREEVTLAHTEENTKKLSDWLTRDVVESIHTCEPTLESVFLTVTGRGLN